MDYPDLHGQMLPRGVITGGSARRKGKAPSASADRDRGPWSNIMTYQDGEDRLRP